MGFGSQVYDLQTIGQSHVETLRILVYLVIYDSGKVSIEYLLLSWYSY